MLERLHKYLAHCGISSRRKAEEIIQEGRVKINGQVVTELGIKVDPEKDRVTVDDKTIVVEKKVYYLLHKPKGCTTTADDEMGRRTVVDLMGDDIPQRVYPVGRLDRDSEGLLVMTNDGDLSYFLTHPSKGVKKVYDATVEGEVSDVVVEEVLAKGVRLGPTLVKPQGLKVLHRNQERTVLQITVAEGINREVRRLFAALGHEVIRLVRLRVGPLALKGITRGTYRKFTLHELELVQQWMERGGSEEASRIAEKMRGRRKVANQPTGKPDPAKPLKIKRIPLLADLDEKARMRALRESHNEESGDHAAQDVIERDVSRSFTVSTQRVPSKTHSPKNRASGKRPPKERPGAYRNRPADENAGETSSAPREKRAYSSDRSAQRTGGNNRGATGEHTRSVRAGEQRTFIKKPFSADSRPEQKSYSATKSAGAERIERSERPSASTSTKGKTRKPRSNPYQAESRSSTGYKPRAKMTSERKPSEARGHERAPTSDRPRLARPASDSRSAPKSGGRDYERTPSSDRPRSTRPTSGSNGAPRSGGRDYERAPSSDRPRSTRPASGSKGAPRSGGRDQERAPSSDRPRSTRPTSGSKGAPRSGGRDYERAPSSDRPRSTRPASGSKGAPRSGGRDYERAPSSDRPRSTGSTGGNRRSEGGKPDFSKTGNFKKPTGGNKPGHSTTGTPGAKSGNKASKPKARQSKHPLSR